MFNSINALYIFLSVSGAALSFFKIGLLASELTVDEFSRYSLVVLLYVYIGYLGSLGANEYILKAGSFLKDEQSIKIDIIRNNGFYYGYIGVLSISLFLLVGSFTTYLDKYNDLIIYVILMSIFSFPYNVFEAFYRAKQKNIIFSGMLFIKSIVAIVLVYCSVDLYGLKGAVASEVLSFFIVSFFAIIFSLKNGISAQIEPAKVALRSIIDNGLNVCLSNMVRSIAQASDRFAVVFLFGVYYFGVYSFVMIIYQAAVLGSSIILNAIGPKLIRNYSDGQDDTMLAKRIWLLSLWFVLFAILLFPIFCVSAPYVIETLYSQYNTPDFYVLINLVYWISVVSLCVFILDWYFVCKSKEKYILNFSFVSLFALIVFVIFINYFSLSLVYYLCCLLFSRLLVVLCMIGFMNFDLKGAANGN